jgi:hypothetical protein
MRDLRGMAYFSNVVYGRYIVQRLLEPWPGTRMSIEQCRSCEAVKTVMRTRPRQEIIYYIAGGRNDGLMLGGFACYREMPQREEVKLFKSITRREAEWRAFLWAATDAPAGSIVVIAHSSPFLFGDFWEEHCPLPKAVVNLRERLNNLMTARDVKVRLEQKSGRNNPALHLLRKHQREKQLELFAGTFNLGGRPDWV